MFNSIFDMSDREFNLFLREKLKEDFTLWKKEKEEVKKTETLKKVEPFDLDKACEAALARVNATVESSYKRWKLP